MRNGSLYNSISIYCSCRKIMIFNNDKYQCLSCGNSYPIIKNVCRISGEFSSRGKMNLDEFNIFNTVADNHFWFKYRNNILKDVIDSQFRGKSNLKILDLGCGEGNTIRSLARFNSDFLIVGCDIFVEGMELSNVNLPLFQGDASDNLFVEEQFDIVLLLDVIEHVPDDQKLLNAAHKLLKKNGLLIVMVPAGLYLWSKFDIISGHFRRYTKKSLLSSINKSSFHVNYITYFMSLILPVYLARALIYRKKAQTDSNAIQKQNLRLNSFVNTTLLKICQIESFILRKIRPFLGASLIAIGTKLN